MAVGNVIIESLVPPKPAGASETDAEYVETVKVALSAYFDQQGLQPARFAWVRRSDIPEDIASTRSFLTTLLGATNINMQGKRVDHIPLSGDIIAYCFYGGVVDCYSSYQVVSDDANATPELVVTVTLESGSVQVPLRFVVAWQQPFP